MKSIRFAICILLALTMLGGCTPAAPTAGSAPGSTATPSGSTTQPTEPAAPTEPTEPIAPTEPTDPIEPPVFVFQHGDDEELSMAYEAGFVPQGLWSDLGATVTLADFVNMVRAIVAEADPVDVAAFDEYMGTAGTIVALTDRSLAAIVLYYATYVLEIPEHTWFSLRHSSDCWATHAMGLNDVMGDRWDEFKHLYCEEPYAGTFPHVYEGGYACEGFWDGSVDVAAYFSMLNRSTYDGRMYFDYDFEENTMHMDYAVSVEDGIRAATRFYVMCHQEELFMASMQEHNANSSHKTSIEDYNIHDFVDRITIGIHYNHGQTDWWANGRGYLAGYDSFYDKMIAEWDVFTSRENQRAVLKAYKRMGFNTIRMPVTWTPYMDPVSNEIDEGYLDYVEYMVNLILDEGFYCIINAHQDHGGLTGSYVDGVAVLDWMEPQYTQSVNNRFADLWAQIAERFKDYGDHLIFEAMNEPSEQIAPDEETGALDYQARRIEELDQIFVDAVRATGGNNEKRALIVSCLWGQIYLNELNPVQDDYVCATTHWYIDNKGMLSAYGLSPDGITMTENGTFTQWSREHPTIAAWMEILANQIKDFQERTGVPVIIGETAACNTFTEAECIDLLTCVLEITNELDCPVILWDGYTCDTDDTSDVGFYLLGKDEWRTPALFEAIMELAEQRK